MACASIVVTVATVMAVLLTCAHGGEFIWLSDLHFDPYYGTEQAFAHTTLCTSSKASPFGSYGCDSPWALIEATLDKAAAIGEKSNFVLVTGDSARHDNDLIPNPFDALEMMMANISHALNERFQASMHLAPFESHMQLIASILGNNDVIPDYYLDPSNALTLFQLVVEAFGDELSVSERQTMLAGGYFSRQVTEKVVLVSLNTVIYSLYHKPKTNTEDPFQQFAWLATTLSNIAKQRQVAYIVGHIPPVLGSYAHTQFWKPEYMEKYYSILTQHLDTVKAQLYGHIHSDEFRVPQGYTKGDQQLPPLFLQGAVTPVYDNNPNFRRVLFDDATGEILDFAVFTFDLSEAPDVVSQEPGWYELYSFKNTYGSAPTSTYLVQLAEDLRDDTAQFNRFKERSRQGYPQQPCDDQAACQIELYCAFTQATTEAFDRCTSSHRTPQFWWMVATATVSGVCAVTCLVVAIQCVRIRRLRQPALATQLVRPWSEENDFVVPHTTLRIQSSSSNVQGSIGDDDGDDDNVGDGEDVRLLPFNALH
eukprot:m.176637 g.176637  ORF g.176637 m.176637 type:complete len:536 (-) comp14630_c0_seq1:2138-3745(-)